MRFAPLLCLLALAACANVDEEMARDPEVDIVSDNHYQILMPAPESAPPGSASAESHRLEVIGQIMQTNGYCPAGWTVSGRRVETRDDTDAGPMDDIYYDVLCKTGS